MNMDSHQVKCKGHSDLITKGLRMMMENGSFSDVTLISGSNKIKAHKCVLVSTSMYFKNLFEDTQFKEEKITIVLKETSKDSFQKVIEFMYLGKVNIQKEDIPEFIKVAEDLRLFGMDNLDMNESNAQEMGTDEEQNKVLDLSHDGPDRKYQLTAPTYSYHDTSESIHPGLIDLLQAHLNNPTINLNAFRPFDNHSFNTALAMKINSAYLSAQLNSPARTGFPAQTLPRQSSHKAHIDRRKRHCGEDVRRETANLGPNNRRFSNSPENSNNSNASIDLTKSSPSNNLLERLQFDPSKNSLTSTQNINSVSATIASQLYQLKPQISMSQFLLSCLSRSRSPNSNEDQTSMTNNENESSNHQEHSPRGNQQVGKHISSGGSSCEYNKYSNENESSEEDNKSGGRARSGSPGPSTSTPRASEVFVSNQPSYNTLPWNYSTASEDTDQPSETADRTKDLLARMMRNASRVQDFAQNNQNYHPVPNPFVDALNDMARNSSNSNATQATAPPMSARNMVDFFSHVSMPNAMSTINPSAISNSILLPPLPPIAHLNLLPNQEVEMQRNAQNNETTGKKSRKRKASNSNDIKYHCSECTRSYASNGNLKRHLKYECGQEPKFPCYFCPVKFQHRHSRKIHCKSTHKKLYEEIYEKETKTTMIANNVTPMTSIQDNQSPGSSSTLQIVDEANPINFSYKTPPSYRQSGNINTHGQESVHGPCTIATAKVSLASVGQDVDTQFRELQQLPSNNAQSDSV